MTVRSGAGKFLRENLLLIATLLGVVLGIGLGIGLYFAKPGDTLLLWIGFPGELVLRAFKLLILPLVVSCVINITASSSIKANGTMGGLAMLYIVTTNLIGALLGLLFVVLIQPGSSDQEGGGSGGGGGGGEPPSQTVYTPQLQNGSTVFVRQNGTSRGMNILGALFVSVLFGLATSAMGSRSAETFREFFDAVTRATILLLSKVIWCLPLGLMSLIAKSLAEVQDMEQTFISLGTFIGTVVAALTINQFIVHLAMFLAFARRNPFPFYWKMMKAYLVAFSANSSVSALPVMLECADNAGLRPRISRFILPLCCNTNSDGSCAYIAASVTFLAQLTGTPLSFGNYILIVFLAGVSGLSLPSVPSSSIIVIIGILSNLGIPDAGVSLLYTGEFILDRLRTGCNTWSHCTCAAAMDARIPQSDAEKAESTVFVEEGGVTSNNSRDGDVHSDPAQRIETSETTERHDRGDSVDSDAVPLERSGKEPPSAITSVQV
uniref:Amino acid transporter n=1 Tax=Macrostomum lignano TaxID=282301 RepID=A0A1I8J571_9PLAT